MSVVLAPSDPLASSQTMAGCSQSLLESMPLEIALKIISYLSFEDANALRQTSKIMHRIISLSEERVHFKTDADISSDEIARFRCIGPLENYKCLKISVALLDLIDAIYLKFPNIPTLDISRSQSLTKEGMKKFFLLKSFRVLTYHQYLLKTAAAS